MHGVWCAKHGVRQGVLVQATKSFMLHAGLPTWLVHSCRSWRPAVCPLRRVASSTRITHRRSSRAMRRTLLIAKAGLNKRDGDGKGRERRSGLRASDLTANLAASATPRAQIAENVGDTSTCSKTSKPLNCYGGNLVPSYAARGAAGLGARVNASSC